MSYRHQPQKLSPHHLLVKVKITVEQEKTSTQQRNSLSITLVDNFPFILICIFFFIISIRGSPRN